MPLDTTPGGALADSYLTVAEAGALAASDTGPEATLWLAGSTTDAQREAALRRATRDLDAYLRTGWGRWFAGQALLFPRIIDIHTVAAVVVPFIPRDLQLATYEQATYVHANAPILDRANQRRARELVSVSEPNRSYTRTQEGDPVAHLSPQALHYLAAYRTVASRRGLRQVRMAGGYAP